MCLAKVIMTSFSLIALEADLGRCQVITRAHIAGGTVPALRQRAWLW